MDTVEAHAVIRSDNVFGLVSFAQVPIEPVVVTINIYGLTDGKHGIHVHDVMTHTHFSVIAPWSPTNPRGAPHGTSACHHTGDLCNNIVSKNGVAEYEYTDMYVSLMNGDPANIVGHTLTIHADPDDEGKYTQYTDQATREQSRITGNAGSIVAQGTIRYFG